MDNNVVIAYIGLGSNIGQRENNLDRAIDLLHHTEGIRVEHVSPFYNTTPIGYTEQPDFLNAVVEVGTILSPSALLKICQGIEHELKRVRTIRWGPRIIDVDILLYGNQIIEEDEIIIPHPRMHEREFVIQPLCDIAPCVIHPILGVTINEIRKKLKIND